MLYRLLRAVVRGMLRAGWHLAVSGTERLPRSPYLLIANHSSEIDPVILSAALPLRPTYLVARDLDRFPVLFRIIRWFDPVFVRRGLADIGSIKACLARLAQGDVLVIFPEGRVVQDAGLGAFHPGAAFVALRAGVPVVPVAIIGAVRMWPLGARWPRPSRLHVRVGEPVIPETADTPETLTTRARDALIDLLGVSSDPLLADRA